MALELNAKCSICGKPYHICDSCLEQKTFKPWKTIADSINCYKIYTAISNYNNKHISKEETKRLLKNCDIDDYKEFVPEIALVIEEILKEEISHTEIRTNKKTNAKKALKITGNIDADMKDNE